MPLTLSGDIAGLGKIVQVVRATDTATRSTASTSFVDASISVTITPKKIDSAILLIWLTPYVAYGSGSGYQGARFQITDAANNPISGGEGLAPIGVNSANTQGRGLTIAFATPATTSATTYKGRFSSSHTTLTVELNNSSTTAQLFAIEVAA